MQRRRFLPTSLWTVMVLSLVLTTGAVRAQDFTADDCAGCHTDSGGDPPEVSTATLAGSAHEDLDCTDCHTGIEELPHGDLPPVNCGQCHDDVAAEYVQHGRGHVGESDLIPACKDCHGTHHILPPDDPQSTVYPVNLPSTCGRCHEDSTLMDKAGLLAARKHLVQAYRSGIHGQSLGKPMSGLLHAPSCNDCHGVQQSGHQILPPNDPRASINYFNIANTCGNCHKDIADQYKLGIHGQLVAQGEVDAPTCITCHREHAILPPSDPRSPVSPGRVATATCAPCHDSAIINEQYSVPVGHTTSYIDSYHGLKSGEGDKRVANCASCHGAHLILPPSDPASSVNPQNLTKTCGQCHHGITAKVAAQPIHQVATQRTAGAAFLLKKLYIGLIILVIGGMFFHCLIDWLRQALRTMRQKPQVRRMTTNEVLQHLLLAISFSTLVLTGFALRFHDAWWVRLIFAHDGGFHVRGLVHRVAGVLMSLGAIWHVIYVVGTARGRAFIRDMVPRPEDATQAFQRMGFNLGLARKRPVFRRFSYVEKAEYWALIWGTVVMVVTGLSLWFDNQIASLVPWWYMDVAHVVHYYEAWLAFLAILVWHMYGVIFNPEVYPMNPSWIDGKMPKHMYEDEHGLAELTGPDADRGTLAAREQPWEEKLD